MFGAILGGLVGGLLLGGGKDEPQQAAAPQYNASSGQTGSDSRMLNEGGAGELTQNSMTAGVKSINNQIGGDTNKYAEMYYNKPQIQRRERALTSFN